MLVIFKKKPYLDCLGGSNVSKFMTKIIFKFVDYFKIYVRTNLKSSTKYKHLIGESVKKRK